MIDFIRKSNFKPILARLLYAALFLTLTACPSFPYLSHGLEKEEKFTQIVGDLSRFYFLKALKTSEEIKTPYMALPKEYALFGRQFYQFRIIETDYLVQTLKALSQLDPGGLLKKSPQQLSPLQAQQTLILLEKIEKSHKYEIFQSNNRNIPYYMDAFEDEILKIIRKKLLPLKQTLRLKASFSQSVYPFQTLPDMKLNCEIYGKNSLFSPSANVCRIG